MRSSGGNNSSEVESESEDNEITKHTLKRRRRHCLTLLNSELPFWHGTIVRKTYELQPVNQRIFDIARARFALCILTGSTPPELYLYLWPESRVASMNRLMEMEWQTALRLAEQQDRKSLKGCSRGVQPEVARMVSGL